MTLITEKLIDLRCFDAKKPNNSENNRYAVSNIDQWLNKDLMAGTWYVEAHGADQSPNAAKEA